MLTQIPPAEPTTPPADGEEAVLAARQAELELLQLREAVKSQRVIGIAIGVLAQRYECGTEAAWALLTRVSSHTNTKVREVARVLVDALDGRADAEDAALLSALSRSMPVLGLRQPGYAAPSTARPERGGGPR